jgi:hypothetical protein
MSPRNVLANIQNQSQVRSHNQFNPAPTSFHNDPPLFAETQNSRTYESFWREQSQKATTSSTSQKHPSLAPPADISTTREPSSSRRSETPKFSKQPTLPGRTISNLSQSTQASQQESPSPTPRTPSRIIHPIDTILHRADQKSDQERDAIETLLFMSSPKHTFPPPGETSSQPSPLRAEFHPHSKVLDHHATTMSSQRLIHTASGSTTPQGRAHMRPTSYPMASPRGLMNRASSEMIDRMLDEVESDSDHEEIEIPITPRRLALAGGGQQ